MFIQHGYIEQLLKNTLEPTTEELDLILQKARRRDRLGDDDIAALLKLEDEDKVYQLLEVAGCIKEEIYGNRVVIFAPLYISDYCTNNCTYCGYKRDNTFKRRKLTMDEIRKEVRSLEKNGHKRLALELGEHPAENTIEYVIEAIKTIYETQQGTDEIRRVNVNIAATTVENYRKLKDVGIGTYILFQETYHQPTYQRIHPKSVKGDYNRQLLAFDRSMQAGVDDVGAGVLFGLYDYMFEVMGLILHNRHLEDTYGVGFHTISVPRLQQAEGVTLEEYPHMIDDLTFKKVVAILRLAVPLTGIILSSRESANMRSELIKYGVTQISAGSCTNVGGYSERDQEDHVIQFEISDERSPSQIISELLSSGYIPSYCTACYRKGRTGDRFMQLARSGEIKNICAPNALMTLVEYIYSYGDEALHQQGEQAIKEELEKIPDLQIRQKVIESIDIIKDGKRDLYL